MVGKVIGWLQEKVRFRSMFSLKVNCVLTNYDHGESEGRGKRRESHRSAIFGSLEAAKGWWEGARKKEYVSLTSARAV